tara:strand:+ start:1001 stop:1705 length:705 start_codon:yes stop_codon:yes gene_type:complete
MFPKRLDIERTILNLNKIKRCKLFKRRERRSIFRFFYEVVFSLKGISRAIEYVGIRLKRIPDTPHKISLGMSCGIFASFTPLFGLHFLIAGLLSYLLRANVLASLIGTFVGNPITFPIITVFNLKLGEWLLGSSEYSSGDGGKIFEGFLDFIFLIYKSFFTEGSIGENSVPRMNEFLNGVFIPYSLGGLILGIFSAIISYFLLRSLVSTYQKKRDALKAKRSKKKLLRKIHEIR